MIGVSTLSVFAQQLAKNEDSKQGVTREQSEVSSGFAVYEAVTKEGYFNTEKFFTIVTGPYPNDAIERINSLGFFMDLMYELKNEEKELQKFGRDVSDNKKLQVMIQGYLNELRPDIIIDIDDRMRLNEEYSGQLH
jgi:hypothetical protein